jgi:hypothetical protein
VQSSAKNQTLGDSNNRCVTTRRAHETSSPCPQKQTPDGPPLQDFIFNRTAHNYTKLLLPEGDKQAAPNDGYLDVSPLKKPSDNLLEFALARKAPLDFCSAKLDHGRPMTFQRHWWNDILWAKQVLAVNQITIGHMDCMTAGDRGAECS